MDRIHGSSYLIYEFLKLLIERDYTPQEIQDMNYRMRSTYPDMAIIEHITHDLDLSENYKKHAETIIDNLDNTVIRLRNDITAYLSKKSDILTFSNSQTVIDVLETMEFKKIYCMESIPGGEGRFMAKSGGGELISDKAGYKLLPEIDAIILGCDRYNETSFINKIGTRELCDRAKTYNCKIVVLTSKYKQVKTIEDVMMKHFERISRNGINLIAE